MVTRVDHIDIRVTDVEVMVEEMKRLGFIEIRRTTRVPQSVEIALPGENQVIFEVRAAKEGEKLGINHVAFKIDSPEATIEELKEKGIEFTRENHLVKDTGRRVSNFKDSNKFSWQLTD